MAINPRAWIYGLIDALPGILSGPARAIADRIFSIFDDGIEFARWLKSGFDYLRVKGSWALFYIRNFAIETLTTIQWLVITRIPQLISIAASQLRTWATSVINGAINGVKSLVSTLRKWTEKAINAVNAAITKARDWLLGKINAITSRLSVTVDKWYDRMTNPTKMAEWLIAALMGPLFRYLNANKDKIAGWFINKSPAFTAWLARELDAILRRIL